MDIKYSNSSLKILAAAEKVFVEKGYDGSRVDEIAERAMINKSQLYYYFGSKENILKELMKKNIREAEEIVDQSFNISEILSQESFEKFIGKLFDFFKTKENIIRIAMIEMFKTNSSDITIFEMFAPLYKKIEVSVERMGLSVEKNSQLISFFFLDIMPLLTFITFSSKFSQYYGISQEGLELEFSTAYKRSQLKYFENLYTQKELLIHKNQQ